MWRGGEKKKKPVLDWFQAEWTVGEVEDLKLEADQILCFLFIKEVSADYGLFFFPIEHAQETTLANQNANKRP